jgi:small nuclear ribonucleoprotein (snRNP)-like protein
MKIFGAPYPTLKRVIVNTKSGEAIRGVLWAKRDGWLVVRNAEALQQDGRVIAIDGEALIDKDNVAFMQVLNP